VLGDHAAFTAMSAVTGDVLVDRLKISNGIARLNRLEPEQVGSIAVSDARPVPLFQQLARGERPDRIALLICCEFRVCEFRVCVSGILRPGMGVKNMDPTVRAPPGDETVDEYFQGSIWGQNCG
jgi:hypothetical protein